MNSKLIFFFLSASIFILVEPNPAARYTGSGLCGNKVNNYQECVRCVFTTALNLTPQQRVMATLFCKRIIAKKIHRAKRFHHNQTTQLHDRWMEQLSPQLQNKSINMITIPGSHDSGSYSISSSSKLDPSAEKVFQILNFLFGKEARKFMTRWSITQDLNFTQQLNAGVRYFDMRISKNIYDNNQFYLVHSLYASKVKLEFDALRSFLNSHPKEVVLLDFNHFYNMNENDHKRFIQMIQTEFDTLLLPVTKPIPNLRQMWNNKRQVISFYHHDLAKQGNNSRYVWPGFMVPSPWANTDDTNQLIEYLNRTYHSERLPHLNLFYISQGVLTPSESTIMKNLGSTLKIALSNKASQAFLKWLDQLSKTTEVVNISIVDFVEDFGYIEKILFLNDE